MLEGLLGAISVLLEWQSLLWLVAGVLFGMFIGFIPGMAGSVALALLIPVSIVMDPTLAVLFLIGAYSPAGFGGMLTSILVNTPGDPENAATTFDGYPMTRQGRAGAAIGAATAASILGGLLGTIALLALIPVAEQSVMAFSYPEFLMLAILGLSVIAVALEGGALKGFISAGFGLMLAFIGLDPVTGSPRLTFDQTYLWDGIDIVPMLLGLFAGAEVLDLFGRNQTVSQSTAPSVGGGKVSVSAAAGERDPERPVTFWEGAFSAIRRWFLVVRSSVIGTLLGIIPGVGGSVSGFMAYSHAKQSSKHPERFGRGEVDGVIAAEAANDAKAGGAMLPTVAFGIPGTVGMAVMLGALIMHGLPVGPALLAEHTEIVYMLIVGMAASKFVAPFIVWAISKQAHRLASIKPGVFTPLIGIAALVGTYTVRVDIRDVLVAIIFGYIGYAMRRYGYSRIALIIAVVLGELVERSFFQTVNTFGSLTEGLARPIAGTLGVLTVVVLGFGAYKGWKRAQGGSMVSPYEDEKDTVTLRGAASREPGRVVFVLLLLIFSGVVVWSGSSIETQAGSMPFSIGLPVAFSLVLVLAMELVPRRSRERQSIDRDVPEPSRAASGHHGVPPLRSAEKVAVSSAESEGEVPESGATTELLERQVLKRQAIFTAWLLGFVALGWLFGFSVSIPIALFVFLILIARETLVKSLFIAAGAGLVLYGLFDFMLGIPLS